MTVAVACHPVVATAAAQPARAFADSARARVERAAGSEGFSGVVLVARGDSLLYQGAWGLANETWRIPNSPGTRFEIASLTKQFTGAAVAQLAAAGKVDLDAPIPRYLPYAPEAWKAITVEQLLTHTSGLPANELKDFTRGIAVPYSEAELVSTFKDRPLAFRPGSSWRYTNTEYYLLAFLIQRTSGESYPDYLTRHLFVPLDMRASGYAATTAVVESLATGYVREGGVLRERDYFDRSLELGAGGVYSTAADLWRWSRALDGTAVMPPAQRRRYFAANNRGDYGYGLFVERGASGERQWHEGSDPGFGAFMVRRPGTGLFVVVLSNHENAPVRPIAEALENLAQGM